MSDIMLYKKGTQIDCGPHTLDYIIVDDLEVDKYLALGWVKTPEETATQDGDKKPKASNKKATQDGENKG